MTGGKSGGKCRKEDAPDMLQKKVEENNVGVEKKENEKEVKDGEMRIVETRRGR